MGTLTVTTRSAWEDRFARPDAGALIEGVPKPQHQFMAHARERLLAIPGVREEVRWLGVPWRWSMVYLGPEARARPIAYLVPDPAKPRLAVPLAGDIVAALPLKKLPKFIREGLSLAPIVNAVRWCQWELPSKSAADDVLSLAELNLPEGHENARR